jgi:RHS repeat-associated protein
VVSEDVAPMLTYAGGERRWHLKEVDGTTVVTSKDLGMVVGHRRQGVYGQRYVEGGSPERKAAFHGRWEEEAGLVAMGPRHVNRVDGRWLQPEPLLMEGIPQEMLGDPRGLATYRYSRNTPTTYQDQSGRMSILITLAATMAGHDVTQDPKAVWSDPATYVALATIVFPAISLSDCSDPNLVPAAAMTMLSVADVGQLAGMLTPAKSVASRGLSGKGGIFTATENAAGGRVVTSVGEISHSDVATQVNSALYAGGEVRVLSGAHGYPDGTMVSEASFLAEDMKAFGDIPGVTVSDVTKMTPAEISGALESPGTTIGAFCNSGACLGVK